VAPVEETRPRTARTRWRPDGGLAVQDEVVDEGDLFRHSPHVRPGSRGRPRRRSPIWLRAISEVPPPMERVPTGVRRAATESVAATTAPSWPDRVMARAATR